MKRFLLSALCISTALFTIGQGMSPGWFEDYLEEKVRVPEYRQLVDEVIDINERFNNGEIGMMEATLSSQLSLYYWNSKLNDRLRNEPPELRTVDESALGTGGAEPFIALHPTDANKLCASYMESGAAFDYPIYYTTDGGSSWNLSAFSTATQHATEFSGSTILGGGDPVLAYESNGTIHMTWIYLRLDGINLKAAMLYAYSTDDGATFVVPGGGDHIIHDGDLLSSDMLDRQWMDVDNSGGTYDGTLYMSAIYFGGVLGGAGEVVLAKPTGTNTFGAPVVAVPITGSEGAQFGNVKVDASGTVHMGCIKFTDQSTGVGNVAYTRSTDGGATWSAVALIAGVESKLPQGSGHMVHDRDNSASSLAVAGSNVYMAWCDQAASDTKALYAYSNDGGLSWSSAIEFGPTLYPGNFYHLMPNVCADGTNASISWYVVDKTTLASSYNIVEITGSGATVGTAGLAGTSNSDFSAASGGDFFGDYNTSVRNGCDTYTIWSDNRSGSPVVYVSKVDACNITGINEQTPINAAFDVSSIYPNPATDNTSIVIDLIENSTITIELFDVNGKLIQQAFSGQLAMGQNTINLNLTSIGSGNYLVKVSDNSGVFATRALIKQ